MDNRKPNNRVEQDLSQWRSREERFNKLFPFSVGNNKTFLREKLHFFEATAARYKDTTNQDERFALRILLQERRRIEEKLYPNLMLRLLRRVIVPLKQQYVIKQEEKKSQGNEQELKAVLLKSGFGNLSNKLDQKMKEGVNEFSIPVSYYHNDKERVDFNLSFVRDNTGNYQLDGYKAQLISELKPAENIQQTFSMEQGTGFSASQAYNLLSGRSVQKDYVTIEGNKQTTWTQLDFNDKDAVGNFRMKEFHAGYGYDLKEVLDQLPLKETTTEAKEKLLTDLSNGSRQEVTVLKADKEQTYYIEANPQHKTINIYDEHSKKVSIASAIGNKTADSIQMAKKANLNQEMGRGKKNELSAS